MHATAYKRHAALMVAIATLMLVVATCPALADDLQVGQPAPPVTLVTLEGKQLSSAQLRGRTVIVTFWATWCEPCRKELPLLSLYAAAHRDQGLEVLGFCLDDTDNLAKVRAVAKGLSFPVGLLEQSSAPGYGRIWRIPVSFVIDRNGNLRYDGWKASDPAWTRASLARVVGPLLSHSTPAAAQPGH